MSRLKELENEAVLKVKLSKHKKKVIFTEMCDQYYSYWLTKEKFSELISELIEILNQMED